MCVALALGKGRKTGRPSSATKTRQISTLDNMKRDTTLPKSSRTPTATATTTTTTTITKTQRSSTGTGLHQCVTCNKSYDDKRNYDIHKLYCRN
jgi:hypothetical protein